MIIFDDLILSWKFHLCPHMHPLFDLIAAGLSMMLELLYHDGHAILLSLGVQRLSEEGPKKRLDCDTMISYILRGLLS